LAFTGAVAWLGSQAGQVAAKVAVRLADHLAYGIAGQPGLLDIDNVSAAGAGDVPGAHFAGEAVLAAARPGQVGPLSAAGRSQGLPTAGSGAASPEPARISAALAT
jgi:hypothetical protein